MDKKECAIKIVQIVGNKESEEKIRREAEILSGINSEYCCRYYHVRRDLLIS